MSAVHFERVYGDLVENCASHVPLHDYNWVATLYIHWKSVVSCALVDFILPNITRRWHRVS